MATRHARIEGKTMRTLGIIFYTLDSLEEVLGKADIG